MTKNILTLSLVMASSLAFAKKDIYAIPDRRDFPINEKVNPCEDFHKYVCSNVEDHFKMRPDRSIHMFAFSDSRERILEAKKKFLKNIKSEKNLTDRALQIKDNYLACMNQSERKSEEIILVKKTVEESQKIKNISDFVAWNWNNIYSGKSSLFSAFESNNPDDPKKLDLAIYASILQLPDKKYYENPALLSEYQKILEKFFLVTGLETKKDAAALRSQKFIQFETEAAKKFPEAAIRRQRWTERRQFSQNDFSKKYINLDFSQILKKIPEKALVFFPIPEGLDFIYENLKPENLDTLKDIYLYKLLSEWMDASYPDFYKMKFEMNKKYFGGPVQRPDLQERCTQRVTNDFLKETDQILTERLFPHFNDQKVIELGSLIRASIQNGIKNNQWLSAESKAEALNKISKAKLFLVRPQNEKEWDFVPVQKYSSQKTIENKFIFNKARLNDMLDKIQKPANLDKWDMGPLTVNAYYSAEENKFVLPMGILQYPFYDEKQSLAENLAAVGAVMGHELGHSIDDQGSKYDSDGKLRQWMSMKDLAEFSSRGAKMIDQFSKAGFDGKLTLGENVADLVGLTFAHQAAFPKGPQNDPQNEQRKFYISYARTRCSVARPDFMEMLKKTDPHSAGWARINEQVKHQKGFQEAFQCKDSDPMVIKDSEKIHIW